MEKPKTIAEQLFGEALDLPPEHRAAFLDAACRGSHDVRQAVEALLAKNDQLQERLRAAIFLDGGYFLVSPGPGTDQADFAPRMKKPVLMVNGRYDFTFPVQTAQDPLFRMLGTPTAEKRHVILDTPHDVTEDRPALVREVLSWLDRYLGPVGG